MTTEKTIYEKVFERLNDEQPDLLARILDDIQMDEDKSISIDQYMNLNPKLDPHEQDDEVDDTRLGLDGEETWLP